MMSPMLNASNLSFEELVFQTCFDQANESTADEEGTYAEKHEAFLAAYDKCMEEQEGEGQFNKKNIAFFISCSI